MTKAVAKKEETAVSTQVHQHVGHEEILSSDIMIPKLLLMQGLSELVNEGKARQGDMVRSTTGEVLGNAKEAVEFIPLTFYNQWIIQELVGKKYEYRGVEPMTAKNQDLPWEFEHNGSKWKRVKSINVYALLPKDIARERKEVQAALAAGSLPDPSTALMPVLISFRSTSYNAGKTIVTHFARAQKYKVPAYVSTLKLTCTQDKNDLGSFFVFGVEPAGKTAQDDQTVAQEWYQILSQGKHKVDDSDLTGGESASSITDY
jgi:hypothetical protein